MTEISNKITKTITLKKQKPVNKTEFSKLNLKFNCIRSLWKLSWDFKTRVHLCFVVML